MLWEQGEAAVREGSEALRPRLNIAQNTVQAFLRIMEKKHLVAHRHEGRTFVFRPLVEREQTHRRLVGRLLGQAFEGVIDRLVHSALSVRPPARRNWPSWKSCCTTFEAPPMALANPEGAREHAH